MPKGGSGKRIILFVPRFGSGGAEAFVVNAAQGLLADGYDVRILCIDGLESPYDRSLRAAGVTRENILTDEIRSPILRYAKAYWGFFRYLSKRGSSVDVLHVNAAQGEELPFVAIAKRAGIPIRVLHSHNSSVNSKIKYLGHVLCKRLFGNSASDFLACSDSAAQWLFPRGVLDSGDYKIINNGIDVERYAFSDSSRVSKRRELGIECRHIYLNVGRLSHQKNQKFLLDAFKLISEVDAEALLLIAGDGELRDELKAYAKAIGLGEEVKWLGNRQDIPELLCAADAFLLPSLFEGFPYTLVEAQAAGLPCVTSDKVSHQCALTNLCEFAPLDVQGYAQAALQAAKRGVSRESYAEQVAARGFDLRDTIDTLEYVYGGDVQ